MPATSGVAALVPPTNVIPCSGDLGQPLTPLEQTIAYPGLSSAKAATSGTMRLLEFAKDCDGCHHGLGSKVLCPPPPPAVFVNGAGYVVSFHGPVDAMLLSGFSVRLVPPTARTYGEEAGQDSCGFFSDEVSLLGETPRAQADEPVSPAATTTVIPSAASAASVRSTSVRDSEYGDTFDSHWP